MKKLYLLPLIMAFAVACQTEEMPAPEQNETIEGELTEKVFTADFSAETKTVLDESKNVKWSSGDKVRIYGGTQSAVADAVIAVDNEYSASFTAVLPETDVYYAVYPATAAKGCTDGSLKLELPAVQTAVAGSFGENAALAVAKSDAGNNFSFKNVCGLLAFNIAEKGVTSVAISSLGNEPLAGAAEVVFAEDGTPEVTATDATAKTVTVSGAFEPDKTYYAAVYSSACEKGISIAYTIGDKTYTYNLHKAGALPARSKVRTISVGTLSAMSAATSFNVASTALVSDYDANVFAKNTALKGNLTDNNGTTILTVPFSAVRTVVNKETSTIDLYDAANDLQPYTVEFAIGNNEKNGVLRRTIADKGYLYGGGTLNWRGKEQSYVASEADPQILLYSGYNMLQEFCFKICALLSEVEVVKEGTLTGTYANNNDCQSKTYGFYAIAADKKSYQIRRANGTYTGENDLRTYVPLYVNEWNKVAAGVGNEKFYVAVMDETIGDYVYAQNIEIKTYILDIRNLRVKFIK